MSRYVGRHRRDALPPPDEDVIPAALPGGNLTLVDTLAMPAGEPTELLPASTWADPPTEPVPRPARLRGPGGKFASAKGPDEQEDAQDKDPEPGEPVRQVPGEKDADTRHN